MKNIRRILASVLVLAVLAVCFSVSASAVIDTEAGKTVTVTFVMNGVFGVNGYFEFSNESMFKSVTYNNKSEIGGDLSNNRVYIYGTGTEPTDIIIEVIVEVDTSAKPGDSCDITLTYETPDVTGQMGDFSTMTETVRIVDIPPTSDAPVITAVAAAATALICGTVIIRRRERA